MASIEQQHGGELGSEVGGVYYHHSVSDARDALRALQPLPAGGATELSCFCLCCRKKRPVRIRPKNVVSLHKKMIQRGAKVKDGPKRIGSGAPDGQEVWDREKTMAENYAVSSPSLQLCVRAFAALPALARSAVEKIMLTLPWHICRLHAFRRPSVSTQG